MSRSIQVVRTARDVIVPVNDIPAIEWNDVKEQATAVRVVSADWYSDLNDAITDAGAGGVVRFTKNTTYTDTSGDPLRLLDGTQLVGEDRFTSVIQTAGEAAIAATDPAGRQTQDAIVQNLTLKGTGSAGYGLDARSMTRCNFDFLRIEGFTLAGVWFGGDYVHGGWSNTLWRSVVHAPASGVGPAILIAGKSGGTGAANGNHLSIMGNILYTKADTTTTYAIDIQHGEGNHISQNDMGYQQGAGVRLGSEARRNNVFSNRTENIGLGILCEGGQYNRVLMNTFHLHPSSTRHPVEETSGSLRNVYAWNFTQGGTAPKYDVPADSQATIIEPEGAITLPNGSMNFRNTFQSITSRTPTDAFDRFVMTAQGTIARGDGTSAPNMLFIRVTGDPEGSVSAAPGSIAQSTNGNVYRKASGTGNTGWVAM